MPPLSTTCGRTPNVFGSHSTRSASLPGSTDPTSPSMPWATAGQIVYLATYRRAPRLSPAPPPAREPPRRLITRAGCPGRLTTPPPPPPARAAPATLQRAPAALHHVRGLPGAHPDLADPAHRRRVRADHRDGPEVVQQVLRGDRRRPDAALGEGEVLRDAGVQVVADHEHVEVLVQGVH